MATLTIRQLDERTKARLRVRAAHHGRSMEEEAREILRVCPNHGKAGKGAIWRTPFVGALAQFGGVELEIPKRDSIREPPDFSEMIVLDTNVVSELMRPTPSPGRLLRWARSYPKAEMFTTAITEAEIFLASSC